MPTSSSAAPAMHSSRPLTTRRRGFIDKLRSKTKARRSTLPGRSDKALPRSTIGPIDPQHPNLITGVPQPSETHLFTRNDTGPVHPQQLKPGDMLSALLGRNPIAAPGPPASNTTSPTSLLSTLAQMNIPGLPGLGPLAGLAHGPGLGALEPLQAPGPLRQALPSHLSPDNPGGSLPHANHGSDPFTTSIVELLDVVHGLREAHGAQAYLEVCFTERAEMLKHDNIQHTTTLSFRDQLKIVRQLTEQQLEVLAAFAKKAEDVLARTRAFNPTVQGGGPSSYIHGSA